MISIYFWGVIYGQLRSLGLVQSIHSKFVVGGVLDHTLPVVVMIIDFIFFNRVPFTWRHSLSLISTMLSYGAVNSAWTILYKEVYPGITWRDAPGILMPLGLFAIILALQACLIKLSECKIKRLEAKELASIQLAEMP